MRLLELLSGALAAADHGAGRKVVTERAAASGRPRRFL
jgi:hypothetical protein